MHERIREMSGLTLAVIGIALVPIGWYFSRMLWIAAFVLAVVGLILLLTDRVLKSEHEIENSPSINPAPIKQSVPGDIHNYSGWQDGGRNLGGDHSGSDADD